MHAHRPDAAILDRTEKGAEAIDERLAADKADIFMPEPKPISSQTSLTGAWKSSVKAVGGGPLRSRRRRGNSSPISRSFRALSGLAFRLP
jgi:hypothetical protein